MATKKRGLRDFQRSKVYRSEQKSLFGDRISHIDDISEWVNEKIIVSRWYQNRWPMNGKIIIKDGRGRRRACGYSALTTHHRKAAGLWLPRGGVIKLPLWSRHKLIILHELAHVITGWFFLRPIASHGPEFCNIYLQLVRRWMGTEAYRGLKESFKEHKVVYRVSARQAYFRDL